VTRDVKPDIQVVWHTALKRVDILPYMYIMNSLGTEDDILRELTLLWATKY